MQVHKYTSTQEQSAQLYMYTIIQVYKYTSPQIKVQPLGLKQLETILNSESS